MVPYCRGIYVSEVITRSSKPAAALADWIPELWSPIGYEVVSSTTASIDSPPQPAVEICWFPHPVVATLPTLRQVTLSVPPSGWCFPTFASGLRGDRRIHFWLGISQPGPWKHLLLDPFSLIPPRLERLASYHGKGSKGWHLIILINHN